MFLGFRLDEWDFRVLFRSLMSRGRPTAARATPTSRCRSTRRRAARSTPERARRLPGAVLPETATSALYWGSIESFVKELRRRVGRARMTTDTAGLRAANPYVGPRSLPRRATRSTAATAERDELLDLARRRADRAAVLAVRRRQDVADPGRAHPRAAGGAASRCCPSSGSATCSRRSSAARRCRQPLRPERAALPGGGRAARPAAPARAAGDHDAARVPRARRGPRTAGRATRC